MGAACTACEKAAAPAAPPKAFGRHSPRSPRQVDLPREPAKKDQHCGQRRSHLLVKEGGFALKNFLVTNEGKVEDYYDVKAEKIGEGGFGAVRKGLDKRTNRMVAIKSIRKAASDEISRLKEEIELMRILDHPNIVRFAESFEDKRCIYIALELCEGGELFQRICKAGHFNETTAAHCVKQMLLAINYMHQNRIMHRDLKPENWLLATKEVVEKAPLKLIDFGISKRFEPGMPSRTKAGTPNYVAPEVLSGRYDEKVDIWSLGVISFMMLTGTHPFSGKSVEEVLQKVRVGHVSYDGPAWKPVSADGKGLTKALLARSPGSRVSAAQALQHTWFTFKTPNDSGNNPHVTTIEMSGLKAFGRMHQFKRAAITVVATQLSDARIDALKSLFMSMDKNNDGTLSIAEIRKGLVGAGISIPANLEDLICEVDTDGSGVVDYTEFLAATMDKKDYNQEEAVWNAFKKFDIDGSGTIDKKELSKVLGDEAVVEAMHLDSNANSMNTIFEEVDTNGDGIIDFEEFFAMMKDMTDQDESAPIRSPRMANRSKSPRQDQSVPSARPGAGRSPRSSRRRPPAPRMTAGERMRQSKPKDIGISTAASEGEDQKDELGQVKPILLRSVSVF